MAIDRYVIYERIVFWLPTSAGHRPLEATQFDALHLILYVWWNNFGASFYAECHTRYIGCLCWLLLFFSLQLFWMQFCTIMICQTVYSCGLCATFSSLISIFTDRVCLCVFKQNKNWELQFLSWCTCYMFSLISAIYMCVFWLHFNSGSGITGLIWPIFKK